MIMDKMRGKENYNLDTLAKKCYNINEPVFLK